MSSVRSGRLAALAASALLLLSACGGDDASTDSAYDSSKPVPGSTEGAYDAAPADVRAGLEGDPWWYPALTVDCEANGEEAAGCAGDPAEGVYNSIPSDLVSKDWNVCAVIPHLQDPYWLAADYGLVEEAERLNVNLDVYEAGGYTELANQLNQIDDCVAAGAEAVVIGAISFDGMDAKVEQLTNDGIIVIDAFNGIATGAVSGRSVASWTEMGEQVANYVAESGESEQVAILPGPAGAGWAEDSGRGAEAVLEGSPSEVVTTQYGESNKNVQLALIEDTLQANPTITTLIANPVGAEAAAGSIDTSAIKIFSTAFEPDVLTAIEDGKIVCASSDQPVIQGKIAVDMAVRLLEGIPLDDEMKRAFPTPGRVCGDAAGDQANLDTFILEGSFAPDGWEPEFHVEAE